MPSTTQLVLIGGLTVGAVVLLSRDTVAETVAKAATNTAKAGAQAGADLITAGFNVVKENVGEPIAEFIIPTASDAQLEGFILGESVKVVLETRDPFTVSLHRRVIVRQGLQVQRTHGNQHPMIVAMRSSRPGTSRGGLRAASVEQLEQAFTKVAPTF